MLDEIGRVHAETGLLIDPHTATGTLAARRSAGAHPVVTMATAHPAKFPDAVERATGIRPALPDHLADLFERPERTETVPNDLAVVEDLVAHGQPRRLTDRLGPRSGSLRRPRSGPTIAVSAGSARPATRRAACLAPSRS